MNETLHHYTLSLHKGLPVFIVDDTHWQTSAFNTAHVWRFCSAMMDSGAKKLLDGAFAAGLG